MSKDLSEYRQHLVEAEQKAQEDYDKTVLALSGGALGVSFAFVEKFIGKGPAIRPGLLVFAWISWGISVALVLISFYLSHLALGKAIKQIDQGEIHDTRPGGVASLVLPGCNCGSGGFFLVGVALIIVFVWLNMGV
jgi:hypothetical protein